MSHVLPKTSGMSVTVIGRADSGDLEGSYVRALENLGCNVNCFDLHAAISRYTRLSRLGAFFNRYVAVENWVRKGNRELCAHVSGERSELLVVVGSAPVRAGSLAQIRQTNPDITIVFIWPDPFLSLQSYTIECLRMYDIVATYTQPSIPLLERLGASRVLWLPFAVDFEVHPPALEVTDDDRARYGCDVIFIAGHRPERELAILSLIDAGVDVHVWGPTSWRRNALHPTRVSRYFKNGPLRGKNSVRASRCAKVCLNMMDPGNYPGANMRFFENFATGTATVNSRCPEMESEFIDGESTLYYGDGELVSKVRELLADGDLRKQLADNAIRVARARHTYRHRASELLRVIDSTG